MAFLRAQAQKAVQASGPAGCRRRVRKWLPRKDLNLDKQDQNLLCYRYTTGQRKEGKQSIERACSIPAPTTGDRGLVIGALVIGDW